MNKRNLLKGLLAATFICATVAMGAEKPAVKGPAVKGNPKSKIYHKPTCRHYTSKNTTVEFKTEDEAKKAGYKGCKQCNKAKKPEDKKETPKDEAKPKKEAKPEKEDTPKQG